MDFVTIDAKTHAELLAAQTELHALKACGVDNWSGYGDAMNLMDIWEEEGISG